MLQARRKQLQIGGGAHTDWGGGGAHIIFLKMTDLCNKQYSICTIKSLTFLQIMGGGARPPRAPPPYSYGPVLIVVTLKLVMLQKVQETKLQFKYYIPLIILMLRFNKPRDRQNWANPIRQYISTNSFNYSEHCFHQLVWVYFLLYMCKKRLLGSFNTAQASKRLHRKKNTVS